MLPWASWLFIKDRHHAFRHHFSIRGHGIPHALPKEKAAETAIQASP